MKPYTRILVVAFALALLACDPPLNNTPQNPPDKQPVVETNLQDWTEHAVVDATLPLKRAMVVVFDASSSMEGDKLAQAKTAFNTYIASLPPNVEVGGIAFDGTGVRELSDISLDHSLLLNEISTLVAGNGTPLGKAVGDAYDMLATWAQGQKGACEYHLVTVTDGEANDANPSLLSRNIEKILQSPVRIFTIGFQINENHSLNMPGRTRYVSADNTEQLSKGLEQVLVEKEE